jgi:hypothetical protein
MAEIDVERLRERLSYDYETGVLRWKVRPSSHVSIGDVAGCIGVHGYRVVRLDRQLFLAHRVAWAIHYGLWPECDLDHQNADKSDNRIANLRLASRALNIANTPPRNLNGLPKGCYRNKGRKRWYSQISIAGKLKRLGRFDTADEAAAAFKRAHREAYGSFSWCEVANG